MNRDACRGCSLLSSQTVHKAVRGYSLRSSPTNHGLVRYSFQSFYAQPEPQRRKFRVFLDQALRTVHYGSFQFVYRAMLSDVFDKLSKITNFSQLFQRNCIAFWSIIGEQSIHCFRQFCPGNLGSLGTFPLRLSCFSPDCCRLALFLPFRRQ